MKCLKVLRLSSRGLLVFLCLETFIISTNAFTSRLIQNLNNWAATRNSQHPDLLAYPRRPENYSTNNSLLKTEFDSLEAGNDPKAHLRHEQMAADTVLRTLVHQTLLSETREKARMLPVPREILYHDGETIATINTNVHGNITRCSLYEIKRREDTNRILEQFARENRQVNKISFRTMLSVITACQAIEPTAVQTNNPNTSQESNNLTYVGNPQQLDLTYMRSIIKGILPGTKWCGLGDIAQTYEDLGEEKNLDKCCRAHDHCPTKLKSFRSGFGLINWSLYTKSHCECDSLLYECLKTAGTQNSDMLGNFYFNVLQVQCIDEENHSQCMVRDKGSNVCKVWGPDTGGDRKMVFRDVRRQF